jgi:hypothetical protein
MFMHAKHLFIFIGPFDRPADMETLYKIEKNVPTPKTYSHVATPRWVNLAKEMKPGDSVLVKTYDEASSLRDAGILINRKIVTRCQKDIGLYRCWLIGNRQKVQKKRS